MACDADDRSDKGIETSILSAIPFPQPTVADQEGHFCRTRQHELIRQLTIRRRQRSAADRRFHTAQGHTHDIFPSCNKRRALTTTAVEGVEWHETLGVDYRCIDTDERIAGTFDHQLSGIALSDQIDCVWRSAS